MKHIAWRAYAAGIYLLATAVVVQFLFAGLGIFADAGFLAWHAIAGAAAIFGLSLLLVAIGWMGGVPGRRLWLTAAVAGLVIVQSLLLSPYRMNASGLLRGVAGLHVVNALVIFWIVLRLLERTLAEREPAGRMASDDVVFVRRASGSWPARPEATRDDGSCVQDQRDAPRRRDNAASANSAPPSRNHGPQRKS